MNAMIACCSWLILILGRFLKGTTCDRGTLTAVVWEQPFDISKLAKDLK